MTVKIALLGEYTSTFQPHIATNNAIQHSGAKLPHKIEGVWVSTEDIDESIFKSYRGIWVAPGSPYKNLDKTLDAIRFAREYNIPCLGTCGGFQHIILEYARSVLGFEDAQHIEYNPYASNLFISKLDCSLVGREMQLTFTENSQISQIYGSDSAIEKYYCNFGVNPQYVSLIKSHQLRVTGSDLEGEVRVVELPNHPFFIGTLFVPQAQSTVEHPHPLVTAFLAAVAAT